jgi:hypothetical protein
VPSPRLTGAGGKKLVRDSDGVDGTKLGCQARVALQRLGVPCVKQVSAEKQKEEEEEKTKKRKHCPKTNKNKQRERVEEVKRLK